MNSKVDIAKKLNELFKLDPQAIQGLADIRIPCNAKLALHPPAMVGLFVRDDPNSGLGIRFLGCLNGILEKVDGEANICGIYEDYGTEDQTKWKLLAFGVLSDTNPLELIYDGRTDMEVKAP